MNHESATSWKSVHLGEVCRVIPGYAFKSKDWQDSGIPVIKIKNITGDGRVDIYEVDYVPAYLRTSKTDKYVLSDGDVLVAMTGATAGKVGRLRTRQPMLLNQRVAKIEPVNVHPEFIWEVLSSKEYQERLYHLADGAAQPNMSGGQIERVVINLPPLPVQRKIAAVLSAYDDLIENNVRRIKILEDMAQMLYREWFVHFRFPGHEQSKMVEMAQGPMPEGWSIAPFSKVCINFDRRRKPLSSIQRADIQGPYPYYGAAKIFDYINDFIFDGDYLLVAEDGSVITPDRKPMLQMAHGKFWANNHTHIIQGKPPISTEFLFLALSHVDITGYITGAAQPKITQENLNRIPIVLAPIEILSMFNETIRPLFQQIFCLQRKQENLRKTRDLLLPKLISGEVDVADLDIAVAS